MKALLKPVFSIRITVETDIVYNEVLGFTMKSGGFVTFITTSGKASIC